MRRSSRFGQAVGIAFVLAYFAVVAAGALIVWETYDHSATAMLEYLDLAMKISFLVGFIFLAFSGIQWLVRRNRGNPGDR